MNLSAREQKALDRIADGLAGPDSNLAAMLATFTRLTADEQMPEAEKIRQGPRRTRRVCKGLRLNSGPHRLAWLPAAVILLVTAIITITAALSGGARRGSCPNLGALTCASQLHPYPSAPHPAG